MSWAVLSITVTGFGFMLLMQTLTHIERALEEAEATQGPSIPTALQDWDAEFERLTGMHPSQRLTRATEL